MAGSIKIEIFKKKEAEEFTACLADPESRLDAGGGAAMCAALSASLLCRAARLTAAEGNKDEALDYIVRNGETLRKYMVHLIDEDVRCRGPLRKAKQEGDPLRIDAASESAVSVCEEIVNMSMKALEMQRDLAEICCEDAQAYVLESAELAMAAMRTAMHYILNLSSKSMDETYRFVTKRENQITLEQAIPVYEAIRSKLAK